MHTTRRLAGLGAAVALLIACGSDSSPEQSTTTTNAAISTTTSMTTTAGPVTLEQPAIWPSADVVFETPEEAAADFVTQILGVEPVIGTFAQSDSRSGEIEVFSPGENHSVSRSLLLLRRLGPSDGWFIIGAASPNATISTPESGAEVPAAPLTVEGVARGFEGTVMVTAFLAGHADPVLDQVITHGGSLETPEPYTATIDLSRASPGDVVTVLVRGDTGLETDPGEFGAIPVVIV